MAINKVIYGSDTLIDITDTTATASDVASGKYFYNAAGVKTQGSASGGGGGSAGTLTKILDVTLTSDTHVIGVTTASSWTSYDYIVFVYDLQLTAKDWIYIMQNSTSPSGSNYTQQLTSFADVDSANISPTTLLFRLPSKANQISVTIGNTINFVPYTASKNFTAGSSVKVYGGTYTGD